VGETLPIPTGGPVWRDGADGRVLDVGLPATFAGEPAGTLRVGLNGTPVERVIDRGRRSVLWFAALTLLFGAGGGIGLLAMDRARHRREEAHRQELRTREQAAAMGRLSAAVAHEVRSPLNAIGMAAQRMERESGAPEPNCARIREIAAAARREVGRINRIVEDFLDLGRGHPLERGAVELAGLVEEVVLAEDPRARREPPPSPVTARVDREELRKALANLMRNARQAAGEGAVVVAWRRDGAGVELEVRDSGPGVPAEEREQVFEHFYTGRPGGTGLGLAVARTAAMRHGGRIMLDDAPEGGARFVLWIPDRESD
jgi:signal transduction histidine kinase